MTGEFVTELPPANRETPGPDWEALVIECQKNPDQILHAASDVTESKVKSLRQRKREPFIKEGGTLHIAQRNRYLDPADGKYKVDVYITWITDTTKEEH